MVRAAILDDCIIFYENEIGGPRLLCLRNAANENARDMAHSLQLFSHVEAIDEIVISWLTGIHSLEKQNQSLLALYSYELGPIFEDEFRLKSLDQVQNYRIEFYRLQVRFHIYSIHFQK